MELRQVTSRLRLGLARFHSAQRFDLDDDEPSSRPGSVHSTVYDEEISISHFNGLRWAPMSDLGRNSLSTAAHFDQSSTARLGTLLKSRVLRDTTVACSSSAMAAIRRSVFPIPSFSR
jgi:hypothetical protein